MDITAILTKEYYNLLKSGLGTLYKEILVENAKDEKVDITATEVNLKTILAKKDYKKKGYFMRRVRSQLMGWLNSIFFNLHYLDEKKPQVANWWFEFSYRVKKAIAVAILLEKYNLINMGGKPEMLNIPQCLVYVYNKLDFLDKINFYEKMKKNYVSLVKSHSIFKHYIV